MSQGDRVYDEEPVLLLVEDDPLARQAVARLLLPRDVHQAGSAAEALAAVATRSDWTGLIVDVGLPEGNLAGLHLLRTLRETLPDIPAVILTGQLKEEIVHTLSLLRADYLMKPAGREKLAWFLGKVDAHLRRFDAIVERASARYDLSARQAEIVRWFLERKSVDAYLAHASISRSTFNKHRDAILAKTGDRGLHTLVARLLAEALGEG